MCGRVTVHILQAPLQHAATHCIILQYTAHAATHRNTLQRTATHCNTLQHAATRCSTLQHGNTLEKGTSCRHQCNTLQHTASYCNTLQGHILQAPMQHTTEPQSTTSYLSAHTATHSNNQQYTATPSNTCVAAQPAVCCCHTHNTHHSASENDVIICNEEANCA